ncbi:MAG: precorrin-6y C5,15-methyltransferase (decarboxylating) subunit CbiE [Geminicoccaceae bacterium]
MSGPWLTVLGVGADGLRRDRRNHIDRAELVVGGARHLRMVNTGDRPTLNWSSPLDETLRRIAEYRGRPVTVLATGDPMDHGVGSRLAQVFGPDALHVIPEVSCFALACARLGWARQDVACISVHGRPLAKISRHLGAGRKLLILTENRDTAGAVAGLLTDQGFGRSGLWVMSDLGAGSEHVWQGEVAEWGGPVKSDLNVLALECRPSAGAGLPLFGLDDAHYSGTRMLTKRTMRVQALAALAPERGTTLWDVGAGSGSITIEYLRFAGEASVYAIERDPERCRAIRANAERLGAPEIQLVEGEAPAALDDLPAPSRIFVGGGLADRSLLGVCWTALASQGRLVAHAVTIEGQASLLDFARDTSASVSRHGVEHLQDLGDYRGLKPAMAVTELIAVKP